MTNDTILNIFCIILLIVLVFLFYVSPKTSKSLTYFDNSTTNRYYTPDSVIIVNPKDCKAANVICKLNPETLEEGCSSCKQLHATCVHFEQDTEMEMDGIQQTITANQPGEGYCLVDYETPSGSCGPWGYWVLTELNDSSYLWLCKCRYPNIFTQNTILDDCTVQVACEGGTLQNIDVALPEQLICTCATDKITWTDANSVPHCRPQLFRDGAFYQTTMKKYFDLYFENDLDYFITKLPKEFEMPNVYVVNPLFLSLTGSRDIWQAKMTKNQLLSEYLNTVRYPLIYRNPYVGEKIINPTLNYQAPIDGGLEMGAIHNAIQPTLVYSKIVLNPEEESSWYEMPWGWHFMNVSNLQTNKKSMHAYSIPKVDPATDPFSGLLGFMPLDNNLWIWSPLLRPRLVGESIQFTNDKFINDIIPNNWDDFLNVANLLDFKCASYHQEGPQKPIDHENGLLPLIGTSYIITGVDSKACINGTLDTDSAIAKYEKILSLLPRLLWRRTLISQSREKTLVKWSDYNYRASYAPYPIPTGETSDWSGIVVLRNVKDAGTCNPSDITAYCDPTSVDTQKQRRWLAKYLVQFPQFLSYLMDLKLDETTNVFENIGTFGKKEWGTSERVEFNAYKTESDLEYRKSTISATQTWKCGGLYPFFTRWSGNNDMWSPPLLMPPLEGDDFDTFAKDCLYESYKYMYFRGSGYVCGIEDTKEGNVYKKSYYNYNTPLSIVGTNGNSPEMPKKMRKELKRANKRPKNKSIGINEKPQGNPIPVKRPKLFK